MGKLIVLVLDGFHESLLEYCSYLKEIYYSHSHSVLKSTLPPNSAPAWSAILTGNGPGEHGIINFVKYDQNFDMHIVGRKDIKEDLLFNYLDRKNYKFFSMYIPFTYPPKAKGDYIFQLPRNEKDKMICPPKLTERHKILLELKEGKVILENVLDTLKATVNIFHKKAQAILEIMDDDYDFIMAYITDTDRVQHLTLHKIDGDTEEAKIGRELFEDLDEFIRQLINKLSPEDDLIIISDHGFEVYKKQFRINNWLIENNYIKLGGENSISLGDEDLRIKTMLKKKGTDRDNSKKRKLDLEFLVTRLKEHENIKTILYPLARLLQIKFTVNITAYSINLDRSDAYCLSGTEKGIYINRRKIKDQNEAETKKQEIISKLNSIPGIRAFPKEDVYKKGRDFNILPDIMIESDDYDVVRGSGGKVFIEKNFSKHHRDAFFCAIGNSFVDNAKFKHTPRLEDITPTVLHMLDISLPKKGMDGRVITEIFRADSSPEKRKVEYHDVTEKEKITTALSQILPNKERTL